MFIVVLLEKRKEVIFIVGGIVYIRIKYIGGFRNVIWEIFWLFNV